MNVNEVVGLILWILAYVLTFKTIALFICSFTHYVNSKHINSKYTPLVSIIVPCYNESLTLENCIRSLSKQTYHRYEIIIVDDGSKDNTLEVANKLRLNNPRITVLTKVNGGKASALNYGIKHSRGKIVVSLDADSIFLNDTLTRLVAPFNNPDVAAVGGNIKVSNRGKMITKNQALEYISGLNIQRRTFAHLGCMQIISGAIGAFRKDRLLEVGGYSMDTIVEDMDVTVTLARMGHKIEYIGEAVAYTEAPENSYDFFKQRYRWIYGGFEVLNKHKDLLFSSKSGRIGMIGLPYIITSLLIDILVTFLLFFMLLRVLFYNDSYDLLPLLITVLMLQSILFFYTVYIDRENRGLALLTPIYIMVYTQFINLITIKAFVDYLRGTKTSWNKVKRLGKNVI